MSRSLLNEAYRLADELDSNHARWVVQQVADKYGIDLDYPSISEPTNRLREQLESVQKAIEQVESLHQPRSYNIIDDDGVQHESVEVCSTCKPGNSLLPVPWPCETMAAIQGSWS